MAAKNFVSSDPNTLIQLNNVVGEFYTNCDDIKIVVHMY